MAMPTRRATLSATGAAAVSAIARGARAERATRPEQPVSELYSALEAVMRAGRGAAFTERFNALAPVVERVFDLDTVLKVSVGVRWQSFDQPTQERLASAFRRFTIASYAANFDKYEGEKLEVLPDARVSGGDRVVRTRIAGEAVDAVRLDYVMRDFGSAWRVVDVLADGSISRVAVQRSDFRAILAGGGAEALIKSLHRKVSDLSGGALSA